MVYLLASHWVSIKKHLTEKSTMNYMKFILAIIFSIYLFSISLYSQSKCISYDAFNRSGYTTINLLTICYDDDFQLVSSRMNLGNDELRQEIMINKENQMIFIVNSSYSGELVMEMNYEQYREASLGCLFEKDDPIKVYSEKQSGISSDRIEIIHNDGTKTKFIFEYSNSDSLIYMLNAPFDAELNLYPIFSKFIDNELLTYEINESFSEQIDLRKLWGAYSKSDNIVKGNSFLKMALAASCRLKEK